LRKLASRALLLNTQELLNGFASSELAGGEARHVNFSLPGDELRYWDKPPHSWQFESGDYLIYIGENSVAAVSLSARINLEG
jgi:aspartokinase-like uncharacterized kinase